MFPTDQCGLQKGTTGLRFEALNQEECMEFDRLDEIQQDIGKQPELGLETRKV